MLNILTGTFNIDPNSLAFNTRRGKMSRIKPNPHPIASRLQGITLSLVGALSLLALPLSGQAATFQVNTSSDDISTYLQGPATECSSTCSLRAAILAANARSGTDTILLGTIPTISLNQGGSGEDSALTGDLDITDDLVITGQIAGGRNIIRGNDIDRVFHIRDGAKVTMQNISIIRGLVTNDPGAGIYVQGSSRVELVNVEVRSNNVIRDQNAANGNSQFQVVGGGIHVDFDATAIIDSSDIVQNTAPSGGGLSNAGRTEIRRSLINANTANGSGAFSNGGGLANLGGFLNVGSSTISGNTTSNQGGGVFITNQQLNIGSVIISNSAITGNQSALNGAGIANLGPLSINNSVVSDNQVVSSGFFRGNGAGIYNATGFASLEMVNSTVSGNSGAYSGGGIFNNRDLSLTNVTLYDNTVTSCVGCSGNQGIGGNQLALFSSSVSNNPSLVVANTIIADGANSNVNEAACAGDTGYESWIQSLGNSMSSDASCDLDDSNDLEDVTNLGLDPNLAIDPDYADSSTAVHALQAGSPAIDAGASDQCPLVDQRFLRRDSGNCDIGAYEFGATEQISTGLVDLMASISDSPDPVAPNNSSIPLIYEITVSNQHADNTANDVVVIIDLPDSFSVNNVNAPPPDSASTPSCSSPDANNVLTCTIAVIPALARAQIFITGIPTRGGTIVAEVEVFSQRQEEAFQNNNNASAETEVTSTANNIDNFDQGNRSPGASSGGGALHPLLLLAGLILLRRRSA